MAIELTGKQSRFSLIQIDSEPRTNSQVLRFIVLLKQGSFETVECSLEDVFLVARLRSAGICGVFENRTRAEEFIDSLSGPAEGQLPGQPREEMNVKIPDHRSMAVAC